MNIRFNGGFIPTKQFSVARHVAQGKNYFLTDENLLLGEIGKEILGSRVVMGAK